MKRLLAVLALAVPLAGCMTDTEYMASLAARSPEYCKPGETMVEHTWGFHAPGSALCKDNVTGQIAAR